MLAVYSPGSACSSRNAASPVGDRILVAMLGLDLLDDRAGELVVSDLGLEAEEHGLQV